MQLLSKPFASNKLILRQIFVEIHLGKTSPNMTVILKVIATENLTS